jgi:hypothetical protein
VVAKNLLGAIGAWDLSMAMGLQGDLDSKLCNSNNGAFRGIPWQVTVELPVDMDLEKALVDPATNKFRNNLVFPNRLPSNDPQVESNTFFIACFILVRKPESGVVVRGERNITSPMVYTTPPPWTSDLRPRSGSSHWRLPRSGGHAASQRRPTNEDYNQHNEEMDVDYDSYELSPGQCPRQCCQTPAVWHL